MANFLDDDFFLYSDMAQYLFHEHAKKLPILDYHCHLPIDLIAKDHVFSNITEVWLSGDHYKWRAMRANGIQEQYCTGIASDKEKFLSWAQTVPACIRNPLYHWTHLELKRYFDLNELLNEKSALNIYEKTSETLRTSDYSTRNLLRKMNVSAICTTDDPIDSLEFHNQLHLEQFDVLVRPGWRPDKALEIENASAYNQYIDQLADISGINIGNYYLLLDALRKRHDFFHTRGCRLSDHGLYTFYTANYTEREIGKIFNKIRRNKAICPSEVIKFKSALLYELAIMDYEKGWVQQFHVGALRNNNSRQFNLIGPDTGYDSIGDLSFALPMSQFLNRLDKIQKLAKSIIYNLNPSDNTLTAAMIGNFQDSSYPGKLQWGAAWWFLDQKDGIESHLNTLSSIGLLSRFVGMITDSRSFLSFPRHEYFRRILCNLIGNDVVKGELPDDRLLLGEMIERICFYNAKEYFEF